ncbi:hypothetical protein BS50DRAFT_592232 [Corynespora cassiicola Philippines]|uniref:Uncharacterized protein n=1 Tax=Corynespora cassiicola Philippines TaxID=1448308 RepID=A0A2T2N947_CORCC|nr:hypothetical protein BS50DRAFT_592232 [Corynespora cassiicola Philippines]
MRPPPRTRSKPQRHLDPPPHSNGHTSSPSPSPSPSPHPTTATTKKTTAKSFSKALTSLQTKLNALLHPSDAASQPPKSFEEAIKALTREWGAAREMLVQAGLVTHEEMERFDRLEMACRILREEGPGEVQEEVERVWEGVRRGFGFCLVDLEGGLEEN